MSASRRRWLAAAMGAGASSAFVLAQAPSPKGAAAKPIGDEGVGPGEDLMREHGVLNRILLVYEEGIRRIRKGEPAPTQELRAGASLIKKFLEDYHERLEEEHLFPRFERAGKLVELVSVLRAQHLAGRRLTASILAAAPAGAGKGDSELVDRLGQFVRMYRPHEAREDTVLFPAFRDLVTRQEYERLGDEFEGREDQVLGSHGFERVVDEVSSIEKTLGIYDLASFTPGS